jgi:hypothetical protein
MIIISIILGKVYSAHNIINMQNVSEYEKKKKKKKIFFFFNSFFFFLF